MYSSMMTPVCTETPKSARNPTPEETLKLVLLRYTARMPAMGAMATVLRMRLAHLRDENMLYKIRKITIRVSGMTSASLFWERFCDSYSPAHSRQIGRAHV